MCKIYIYISQKGLKVAFSFMDIKYFCDYVTKYVLFNYFT